MRTMILLLLLPVMFLAGGSPSLVCQGANEDLDQYQFQAILDALDSPFAKNQEQDRAAAKLRALGTNALPFLMAEVRTLGKIEATNLVAANDLKMKLQGAFKVLGSEAKPLLPELIAEFKAGRSLGVTPYALAQIGGDEAGRALVQAITNTNPQVRASGASAIEYFKTNSEMAKAATHSLLQLLSDSSGPLRALAASTLGTLGAGPDIVVPALLRIAESDPDSVVRAAAIRSIGRFGANAVSAKEGLNKIARADKDEDVRKLAVQALHAIHVKPNQ